MNNNALAGMACPKCNSEGPFKIATTSTATVADTGVIDVENFEWSDTDPCGCIACGHGASVGEFHVAPNIVLLP